MDKSVSDIYLKLLETFLNTMAITWAGDLNE